MQVGKKYYVGDSLGYEKVECLEINPPNNMQDIPDAYVVKVRYVDSGIEDIFFEIGETNFYPHVEEVVGE